MDEEEINRLDERACEAEGRLARIEAVCRPIEWERCRECRDEDMDVRADLILWGKLFPPEALGPKCLDCAAQYMSVDAHTVSQYAVLDLRPLRRVLGDLEDSDR